MSDERTEKQILSNIEDYTRATMRNTKRTAKNVAFVSVVIIVTLSLAVLINLLSL